MTKHKCFLNWSGGKDALFALHHLQQNSDYAVGRLLITVNQSNNRVSMHGVPLSLVEKQAQSLGLPLTPVFLDPEISLTEYNQVMNKELAALKSEGFTHSVFGDMSLDDLKKYREQQLKSIRLEGVFPLWKKDTTQVIFDFIEAGYKAIVVAVNDAVLDKSFCGRLIDRSFLEDLPNEVDPCGENGEFHTFVFDGPLFKKPIHFTQGKIIERQYKPSLKAENEGGRDCFKENVKNWDTRFWFADLRVLD